MTSSSRLHINLQAIAHNYRFLDAQTGPSTQTAAAVKANGYGLGMEAVSTALIRQDAACFSPPSWRKGCAFLPPLPVRNMTGRKLPCWKGFAC